MKYFRIIFLFVIFLYLRGCVCAQRLDIGIEKSKYLYGEFTFNSGLSLKLSESLFSENIKHQQIELTGAYCNRISKVFFSAGLKAGTSWSGSFQRYAGLFKASYLPIKNFAITGLVMPLYDTGYGYSTDWGVVAGYRVVKPLWINLDLTTIPDYRKSELRSHIGAILSVGALSASAAVSLPLRGDQKLKTWRILMGINYSLDFSVRKSKNSQE